MKQIDCSRNEEVRRRSRNERKTKNEMWTRFAHMKGIDEERILRRLMETEAVSNRTRRICVCVDGWMDGESYGEGKKSMVVRSVGVIDAREFINGRKAWRVFD